MTRPPPFSPTDAELIAFLNGQADAATSERIENAMAVDPNVEARLIALDPGLPELRAPLDTLLRQSPTVDLARALAGATEQYTKQTVHVPATSTAGWWIAISVTAALALAAGVWIGVRATPGSQLEPAKVPQTIEHGPHLEPVPVPQVPGVDPPPAPEKKIPDLPADDKAAVARAPDPPPPPVVVAEPLPRLVPPVAVPEPTGAREPPTEARPATAVAPRELAQAAPATWVDAVASYVRLMTTETLVRTAQSPQQLRTEVAEMTERFGVNLRGVIKSVPDLKLQRVERLQLNGRPLLQLGFLDAAGTPVAICIILRAAAPQDPAANPAQPVFRDVAALGLNAVHWDRQPRGFLVIGRGALPGLTSMAQRIDRSL